MSEAVTRADVLKGSALKATGWGKTRRPDAWWVEPAIPFVVFTAFIVYATYRAFTGGHLSLIHI